MTISPDQDSPSPVSYSLDKSLSYIFGSSPEWTVPKTSKKKRDSNKPGVGKYNIEKGFN